jgi:CRP-like cAMP-binding protein
MYGICFRQGATVLEQGARPKDDDCMYFLQSGEADVVITGGADAASKNHGEERKVEGHVVRIQQKPGWLFGDVALLFHSPRTASVVAKTNITVWAMDRRTFLKFVMKYAQGARALRFLRKLPLLKGLSDNDLIRAASRMPQRMYEDGQPLIRIGERGDELFLIRYGKVRTPRKPSWRSSSRASRATASMPSLAVQCTHCVWRAPQAPVRRRLLDRTARRRRYSRRAP